MYSIENNGIKPMLNDQSPKTSALMEVETELLLGTDGDDLQQKHYPGVDLNTTYPTVTIWEDRVDALQKRLSSENTELSRNFAREYLRDWDEVFEYFTRNGFHSEEGAPCFVLGRIFRVIDDNVLDIEELRPKFKNASDLSPMITHKVTKEKRRQRGAYLYAIISLIDYFAKLQLLCEGLSEQHPPLPNKLERHVKGLRRIRNFISPNDMPVSGPTADSWEDVVKEMSGPFRGFTKEYRKFKEPILEKIKWYKNEIRDTGKEGRESRAYNLVSFNFGGRKLPAKDHAIEDADSELEEGEILEDSWSGNLEIRTRMK